MQSKWNVVAPIDLSVDPDVSVSRALDAARAINAELTLLYIADSPWYERACRLGWLENGLGNARVNPDVRRLVLSGAVPETIARYAEISNADLLLLTTQGRRSWPRCWRRSVTGAVMKLTETPVCVAGSSPRQREAGGDYRRILCLLKLNGKDEPVVMQAQALAERTGGRLILLAAIPEVSEGLLAEVNLSPDRPLSRIVALDRMREIGETLSVPYRASVMTGSPRKCVLTAAEDSEADIVVVSRPTPGFPSQYSVDIRSTLRGLACPLLTVAWRTPDTRRNQPKIGEARPAHTFAPMFSKDRKVNWRDDEGDAYKACVGIA